MPVSQPLDTIKTNFNRAKLLIVEDNLDHWMIMKKAMDQCLAEVTPVLATTAQQAITMLNEWHCQEWDAPKLILLDLYLPERTDGWALLRQIKNQPSPCNQIPVIILSTSNDSTDIADSYQLGSSSYIVKPNEFSGWLAYFKELRTYWWETVTLPPLQFSV
ncbi:response regulator [Spirosoma radiotolerans]|uniref:Histidine kinase n=1 Tax=Spirosoma radiotolerans TaxID=1379870 RepID=A0A0E3ZT09_9BACT|nr:response regulator [Spirosoma radiotolerans]AKD54369.1 histidine kinase [Spirosoma radiotolerans]